MKYYINGWEESRGYFLSFGFTRVEIGMMERGMIVKREQNTFEIRKGSE